MKHLQVLSALTLTAVIGLAAGAAFAQPEASPLNGPAKPKVAAPPTAPAVKAGTGGGPGGPAPAPAPLSADLMSALSQHVREQAWPFGEVGLVPSGLNHFKMELVTPTGRRIVTEQSGQLLMSTNISATTMQRTEDGAIGVTYALRRNGNVLTGYTSYILPSGEIYDPPPVVMPLEGGTRTVNVPGGGTMTLTLDGAHTPTPEETARIQPTLTMATTQSNAAVAAAASAAQAKAP